MSDVATRKDIDEVIGIVKDFTNQVDEKFKQVDDRFDYAEERARNFEKKVDARFGKLETDYDHLLRTIDGFVSRIDRYEVKLAARDSQFERLLAWARKVSEKTNITVENP